MNTVVKTDAQKEESFLKRNLSLIMISSVVTLFLLLIPFLNQVAPAAEIRANVQRTFAADADYYTAMADFFLAKNEIKPGSALVTEAARYQDWLNFT